MLSEWGFTDCIADKTLNLNMLPITVFTMKKQTKQ